MFFFLPRRKVLREVREKPGFYLLDYGCGPGSYSLIAAELAGKEGKVYALDIHPLAVKRIQEKAEKKGLTNIKTILSDCETGLEKESVDVVLLYDVFHELSEPNLVLKELNRVLKSGSPPKTIRHTVFPPLTHKCDCRDHRSANKSARSYGPLSG